ncbi:CRISPR-associated endonuclease Cas1 [Vibrio breoganii]|uniref:CRISPR-associated endonuclease Cas1 n=1 Tax=Vibrio breoganii TaxID=553239 RepID=UPI0010BE0F86|nr:CRISPR-associated endonuclease Cas1 [Vibrio breoganii]TKF84876.1 CRISPR-associated endonuclease Cas1 [Vibrio breoganii]
MQTVFIDRKETDLSISNNQLRVKGTESEQTLPIMHIHSIVICCDCRLSSGFLRTIAKHDIALVCLNQRNINATFYSVPSGNGNIHRRLAQYEMSCEPQHKLRLARVIVAVKARSQRKALQSLAIARPELRTIAHREIKTITTNLVSLQSATDRAQLMGYEGVIAKSYFSAYTKQFAPSLAFVKRSKRPATDPVNATLSLSYTIAYYESIRACHAVGLDPLLGILHEPAYGRSSLACDLTELQRVAIDAWVHALFAQQTLRAEHFSPVDERGCMMTKAGRSIYYPLLMEHMIPLRAKIRRHALWLAKYLDRVNKPS